MKTKQWAVGASVAVLVASGAGLTLADTASAGEGGQVTTSAGGRVAQPVALPLRVSAAETVITFDEQPVGTTITDQYKARGVVFAGVDGAAAPFISPDGANPTSPVLSGTPRFTGAIAGSFVVPGGVKPAKVDRFALDVGYIDEPGSVGVTVFNSVGARLGVVTANQSGIVRLTSTFTGASRFVVASVGDEPAGFAIDNLSFTIVRRLAAVGDSYSSGEGAGPYEAASGGCHRSAQAWPRLLAADPEAGLTLAAHVACSGAKMSALSLPFKGQTPQLRQLGAITPAPELVTITIGGNDLGFEGIIRDCVLANCVSDHRLDGARTTLAHLPAALARAYRQVQTTVPDAEVLVVGYPRLLPRTFAETGCGLWLTSEERTQLNALSVALDRAERGAAAAAGVRYASVLDALTGHELCGHTSWVYPITPFSGQESAHPTVAGQRAIAAAVRSALAAA